MSNKIIKPADEIIELYNLGHITGVKLEWRQVSTDEQEVYADIFGIDGEIGPVKWDQYREYLIYKGHWELFKLNLPSNEHAKSWLQQEEDYKYEYNEYLRLKEKFEGDN